jgi:hypothetical protein
MPRLPQPGADAGQWGTILNEFLEVAHNFDGSVRAGIIAESNLSEAVKDKLNAVSAGGATNLSTSTTSTTVTVASDTGNDATLVAATTSAAGVLTAADKAKLDGIAAGAQVNAVASVSGRTGAVTLTKSDVGLTNVDNTSDLGKPVSAATQTALNSKANLTHTHTIADTTGLQAALDSKASSSHTHSLDNLSNVAIATPSLGQVLKYNGSTWVNDVDSTTGGGAAATNLAISSTATTVTVSSDTGTDATLGAATASAAGVLIAADKAKLDGIAAGATVNSPDAELRDRSTHTGSQAASTISDLTETVIDTMGTALVAGSNVTITPDDSANTITIAASGGGGAAATNLSVSRTATAVTVASDTGTDAALLAADSANAGVLTAADKTKLDGVASGATANDTDANLKNRANHTGTQLASTISDFSAAADARISAANKKTNSMSTGKLLGRGSSGTGAIEEINLGTNLSLTGTTLNATGSGTTDPEVVRDTMAAVLVAGSNITITPNDAGDTITITASTGGTGGETVSLNSQSGTAYSLVLSDANKVVETTNSSATTVTVPANSSVAFLVGTTVALRQYGTGQLTVAAGAGVTIRSRDAAYKLGGQYSEAVLTKRATDEWILSGDLTA